MIFEPLDIAGSFLVRPQPTFDERGAFSRVFCRDEFARAGLIDDFAQSSISMNTKAGTVRGMHYSVGAQGETKLVRCTAGAVFDMIVDIRYGSPTYRRVLGFDLTADTRTALYVPAGVAHGFQTVRDGSEVLYMIDKPYTAEAARGFRWNDPVLRLGWPLEVTAMSERDRTYPDYMPNGPA